MELILLEKIHNLGGLGDTVNVKPGYGRNFLLPTGKAIRATQANLAKFEARRAELEEISQQTLAAAQKRAEELTALTVRISAKASEEGKLFGSVAAREIATAVTLAGVEVKKAEIRLPNGSLREVGEFEVDIQLHSDVVSTIKIVVAAEE